MSAMRHFVSSFGALALLASAANAYADDASLTQRQLGSTDAPYGFVEYLPPDYSASPAKKYPVVVFLHGVGEEGNGTTDLLGKMTTHGPDKLIKNGSTYFADNGVLVFAPQSAGWWDANGVHTFMTYLTGHYRIDPRRIYITGISMGGGGAWDYAHIHGEKLAGLIPISGASGPSDGTHFVTLPTWAFHDWDDGTVARQNSIGWVNAIATAIFGSATPDVLSGYPNAGGNTANAAPDPMTAHFDGTKWTWITGVDVPASAPVSLTLYPSGGHDAWTKTYEQNAVWDWLLANQKPLSAGLSADAIVVDNLDAGATFQGTWARADDETGYYGWDEHKATGGANVSATFAATLPPGKYEVKLSYTSGADHASIPVEIVHEGGSTMVNVDMKNGGGSFSSLGTFDFDSSASVVLHAEAATGVVMADAVSFELQVPVDPSSTSSSATSAGSGGGGAGEGTSSGVGGSGSDDDGGKSGCSVSAGPTEPGTGAALLFGVAFALGAAGRRRARPRV